MEHVYALGVDFIEAIQYCFKDYEDYFEFVNNVSNPHHTLEILFPLLSIVDSVFASQLVLCMAFGGWLTAVMKWWLLEDRPYWWVRETDFYANSNRPIIRQNSQTCETGPGCPSGHTAATAMLLILTIFWLSHIVTDRKLQIAAWWKLLWYGFCTLSMGSVMLARMYIGTHFPHQVLAGALIGGLLAPSLCIYVSDPFIWQYGRYAAALYWHLASVALTVIIAAFTYYSLVYCGVDPQWTIKMAFRWCEQPDYISVSTTPMYSLAHCTGHMLGWALAVTPDVANYRHDTTNRSLIISSFATGIIVYAFRELQDNITKDNASVYYSLLFLLCAIKVPLLLRLTPALAMWPYSHEAKGAKKLGAKKKKK